MHTLVMTGATRGIGRVAAAHVVRDEPETHLVLLARGESGRTTRDELAATGARVTLVEADLASVRSVETATRTVRERLDAGDLPPLRAVVGNAGVQLVDALHETVDGYETTFAVNVLAPHLMLRALASRLEAPARVLLTTSDTHVGDLRHGSALVPAPRWSSPEDLARPGAFPAPATSAAGRTAYSTSKLAVIHLVHEWARHLPAGVEVVSYNPGYVPGTGLVRAAGRFDRFLDGRVLTLLRSTPLVDSVPVAGRRLADAILGRTAAASGDYVDRSRVARSSAASYDPVRERELWEFLERVPADR